MASVIELPDDPNGFRRKGRLLVPIPWSQVVKEIVPLLRPDEHAFFVARTGWGKSWLPRHLLEVVDAKRRVTLFDIKASDPLWRHGFRTVHEVPGRLER